MKGQVAEAEVSDQQEMANTRGKLSKFDATLAALKTLDEKDTPAPVETGAEQKVTRPQRPPPAGRRYIALQKEKQALEVLLDRRQQETEAAMTSRRGVKQIDHE